MPNPRKSKSEDSHLEPPIVQDQKHCLNMARTCAAYNLRRAARLVTQAYDQALKPTGLKITQVSLLVSFTMVPDSNMAQQAQWLGMDRTTLSRNLRVLERKGLVDLEQGQDRREQKVRVTPAGQKALKQAYPLWLKAQERVVGGMGHEKWAALAKELRALVAGLK